MIMLRGCVNNCFRNGDFKLFCSHLVFAQIALYYMNQNNVFATWSLLPCSNERKGWNIPESIDRSISEVSIDGCPSTITL